MIELSTPETYIVMVGEKKKIMNEIWVLFTGYSL
jgi:hypothetical protein